MKLIILSSFLTLFVIGLIIPNVYGSNSDIVLTIETNSDEIYQNEVLLLTAKLSKIIPNTPLQFEFTMNGGSVGFVHSIYPDMIIPSIEKSGEYTFVILRPECNPTIGADYPNKSFGNYIYQYCLPAGIVTVSLTYGDKNDPFEVAETTFYLHSELSEFSKKINNYFPTKIETGSNFKRSSPMIPSSNIDLNTTSIDNAVYRCEGYSNCMVSISIIHYQEGIPEFKNMEYTHKRMDFKCNTVYESGTNYEQCSDEFWEIQLHSSHVSLDNRDLFWDVFFEKIKQTPLPEKSNILTSNIIYKYSSTHIENFPDSTKSPQHYLDRYNNEKSYKKWFDSQFPDTTIHEILDVIEPEKPKIPSWVNNTMQWYLGGIITEDEMITAIQYLVKEGIIDIN